MFNIHCWTHIARVSSFIIKIPVRKMILQWLDWKSVVCPFSHSFLWLISKQHNDSDSNNLHQSFLNLLCARPYAKSFIYIIYLIFTTSLFVIAIFQTGKLRHRVTWQLLNGTQPEGGRARIPMRIRFRVKVFPSNNAVSFPKVKDGGDMPDGMMVPT